MYYCSTLGTSWLNYSCGDKDQQEEEKQTENSHSCSVDQSAIYIDYNFVIIQYLKNLEFYLHNPPDIKPNIPFPVGQIYQLIDNFVDEFWL